MFESVITAGFFAMAIMTHVIIWVYTPILLLAGVPLKFISIGWALTYLMSTLAIFAPFGLLVAKSLKEKNNADTNKKSPDWGTF